MNYFSAIDLCVIAVYFSFLVGIGFYLKNKASQSIEDYFIGGRSLPWWALGISGMASYLDITGTMIIVSFIYLLGPSGLYFEFRGGAALCLPFVMLWAGKWHRRSQSITAAEWMIFRFGDNLGGRLAQMIGVVAGVMATIGMLTYLIKGVGMFLSMFLPFSPLMCAVLMVSVATVYTMVSGFYGVVFTDVFQSVIILAGVVYISLTAFNLVGSCDDFGQLAFQVTGNANWMSSLPSWHAAMPKGYEVYRHLILFSFFYLMKNVFLGFGSGHDPKFFGARNDRECGLLGNLWIWTLAVRWPLMIGFVVMGIFLVSDIFPDQTVIHDVAALIQSSLPEVTKAQWESVISGIINKPDQYPDLVQGIQHFLGENWVEKLHLVSYEGTVSPERILPAVLLMKVGSGFRGLILIALLAACMSTFDTNVNGAAGLLLRDIYQKYLRPKAHTKELIYASWAISALIVATSFLFAYTVRSINDIWGWIVMGLGGGTLAPIVLRLYWWRFNGSGFAVGTGVGMVAAIVQRILVPDMNEIYQFLIIGGISLVASIIGTYLFPVTDRKVLNNFYLKTRPFGFWGPLKKLVSGEERKKMEHEHRNDLLALPFTLLWHVTLLLLPMQLVIRSYRAFWMTFIFFVIGLIGMYHFWYKNLPKDNYWGSENMAVEEVENQ